MAASVRVEDEAFADIRYARLADACDLADADHARGKMLVLWRQCTIEQTHNLLVSDVVNVLGPNAVNGLLVARLGDRTTIKIGGEEHAAMRIRGTAGRIEWLKKLRENGKKGGRPRKNQKVSEKKTKRKPSGSENQNPPAPAPAPTKTLTSECLEAGDTLTAAPHAPGSVGARLRALSATLASEWADEANLVARSLGVSRSPLVPSQGEREILRRLSELVERDGRDPDEAAADIRAVLAHNASSARAARKPHFVGAASWKPERFQGSFDRLGQQQRPAQNTNAALAAHYATEIEA